MIMVPNIHLKSKGSLNIELKSWMYRIIHVQSAEPEFSTRFAVQIMFVMTVFISVKKIGVKEYSLIRQFTNIY